MRRIGLFLGGIALLVASGARPPKRRGAPVEERRGAPVKKAPRRPR